MPTLAVGMWSAFGFYFDTMKWGRGKFSPYGYASVGHGARLVVLAGVVDGVSIFGCRIPAFS